MAAIEIVVFAGAAGFGIIVVATVLVIIGVRQEQAVLERDGRRTFAHHEPPTILALLARRVLGAHFNVIPAEPHRPHYPKPDFPLPNYPDPDYLEPDYPEPGRPDEDPPGDDRPSWPKAG
ncbi:MAG TPA: hypothetical protein VHU92_23630 [Streptosporangiaceae bacterium]|nr:hypothetical protein [Streptosporangiaceae bacterium]